MTIPENRVPDGGYKQGDRVRFTARMSNPEWSGREGSIREIIGKILHVYVGGPSAYWHVDNVEPLPPPTSEKTDD